MGKMPKFAKNALITAFILCTCFVFCLIIQSLFHNTSLVPTIFVLGVFVTAFITKGYIYGIIASLISVIAVNFAFTFPFFAFDFTIPENILSAIILFVVSWITCGLSAKIASQEALKAESEKERMRANLLRAVSHDLRTPLTTIYGSTSALLENYGSFSDEQKTKILKGIQEDAQWLSRMVENLLSITKLADGNVKIIKTDTVLDELLDSVLVKFAKRYPEQNVSISMPEEFTIIPMDALLIQQVIINILDNAAQHAKGMTKLSLKVYTSRKKALFEISDDGCGITPEKLKTIFSGYCASCEMPSDGTKNNAGIGLSVCASIIKAHGGEIFAENLAKGGCAFRFTLPMEDSYDEQQQI